MKSYIEIYKPETIKAMQFTGGNTQEILETVFKGSKAVLVEEFIYIRFEDGCKWFFEKGDWVIIRTQYEDSDNYCGESETYQKMSNEDFINQYKESK